MNVAPRISPVPGCTWLYLALPWSVSDPHRMVLNAQWDRWMWWDLWSADSTALQCQYNKKLWKHKLGSHTEAADHAEENLKSRGCTSLAVVQRQFGKNFGINSCFQPRAGTFDCWCDQDKYVTFSCFQKRFPLFLVNDRYQTIIMVVVIIVLAVTEPISLKFGLASVDNIWIENQ